MLFSLCLVMALVASTSADPVTLNAEITPAMASLATSLKVPATFGWVTSRQCNSATGWLGVTCDADGHPISISFNKPTWTGGSLHTSVGTLSRLQSLLLNNLDMTGTIPTEVGRLATLTAFALNGLALSGPIPDSISSLTNLALLSISGGSLNGQIPASLAQLSRLQQLSIGSAAAFNRFSAVSGGIPEALCDIAPLEYLNLGFNRLQGSLPLCLSQLTNLFYLAAPSNTLSDVIPPEIAALPHLFEVDLSNNLLTGPLPDFSSELDSLTLSKNLLSGPLPSSLPPLLTSLALNTNYFTGNLPLFFPLNLTYLDLSDNYFTGVANVFVGSSLFHAFPVKCVDLGASLSKNCFLESSKCTAPEVQRNATQCKSACGTVVWDRLVRGKSQCQGYGTCYPSIPTTTTTVATSRLLSSPSTSTVKRPRLAPGSLPPSWSCACDTNAVIVPNRVDACTCKQKRSWPCVAPGRVNGGCPKFARCYPYYYSCRGVGCFCLSGYTPTYNARKEVVLCTPKTDAAATTKSTSLSAHAASVAEQLGSVRGGGMLGLVSGPARMGLEVAGAVREGVEMLQGRTEEEEEAGARSVRGPARIDLEVEFETAEEAELMQDQEEAREEREQQRQEGVGEEQRRGGSGEVLHSLVSFLGS
ncbi:hypothetical protein CLOM_g13714 [Closterium sp. NIES-68]|nr:hypothetical protein CLOM_g13714 [Closterium sp. NIES-68]